MKIKRVIERTLQLVATSVVLVLLVQANACFNLSPYRVTRIPRVVASGEAETIGELSRLADFYGTDKGPSGHGFSEIYEVYLSPLRHRVKKVLEIGIENGASLRMFADYFPEAAIYGIDIKRLDFLFWTAPRIHAFVADQASRDELRAVTSAIGGDFDLILDDGGHSMEQQQVSLGALFPLVKAGGYYILEDVHTSFGGSAFGARADGSNTTYQVIAGYIQHQDVVSEYMRPEERAYLADHLAYLNLALVGKSSITCIFKKRQ